MVGRARRRQQPRRAAAGVHDPDRVVDHAVRHHEGDEAPVPRPRRMVVPAGWLPELRQLSAAGAIAPHRPEHLLSGRAAFFRRVDKMFAVRRPRGVRSPLDDLLRRAAGRRDNPDAASPPRVKRDPAAVGRPVRLHVLAAVVGDRHFLAAGRGADDVDLQAAGAIRDERGGAAIGRERRRGVVAAVRVRREGAGDAWSGRASARTVDG